MVSDKEIYLDGVMDRLFIILACCICVLHVSSYITSTTPICNRIVRGNDIFVNCSYRGLTSIPPELPPFVASIDFSHNFIQEVKFTEPLVNLTRLNLSHNNISFLRPTSFHQTKNVECLFLNHNKLTSKSYPDDVFNVLKNLTVLHIHNNDERSIGQYPDAAFSHLNNIEELRVDTFSKTEFGKGFGEMVKLKRLLLGYNGCKLSQLWNNTFKHFKNSSIEILDLDYCKIVHIEADAFWWLKNLQELYVSHTYQLTPKTAVTSMYGLRGRNMTAIKFNKVHPLFLLRENDLSDFTLQSEVMSFALDVCVKRFSMMGNQILWVDSMQWSNTRFANCIEHLDLSGNDIYGEGSMMFEFFFMTKLRYLDLSRHVLFAMTNNQNNNFELTDSKRLVFTLPPQLEVLNMSGFSMNGVRHIIEIKFVNGRNLRDFSMAYNGVTHFTNRLRGLEYVQHLDMAGNSCGNMTSIFFDDFPNLRKLNMSNCQLSYPDGYFLSEGARLFKSLAKLKTLVLNRNDLVFMNRMMFSKKRIRHLDLSNNRFEQIPLELLTLKQLKDLDLSFNSLTYIQHSDRLKLDDLGKANDLVLNLEGNLLSCACENIGNLMWFQETIVNLMHRETYQCLYQNGSVSRIPASYRQILTLWRGCVGRFWFFLSSFCFLTFLLSVTLIKVFAIRRTMIINFILRMFGFNTVIKYPSRSDYKYDVFVGYSEPDCDYVLDTIMPLEARHNLKAYMGDRDMLPGDCVAQEIVKAVDSSWKAVLVLTPAFLEDNWCRFISDFVVYVSTFRPPGSVILIVFEGVRKGDIPPPLLNIIDEEHIFKVGDFQRNEASLWDAVCCSILNHA